MRRAASAVLVALAALTAAPLAAQAGPNPIRPGDFFGAPLLSGDDDVRPIGRLAEVQSPTVVPGAFGPQIGLNDRVYVALSGSARIRNGDGIHFFRPVRQVGAWGWVFQSTGIATVMAVQGGTATARIDRMYDKVAAGDLAVPPEPFAPVAVAPSKNASPIGGLIIAFASPHPLQMPNEIVFLDLGADSGVQIGDEFVAFVPRQPRDWGIRPEIPIGRLQVVRVAGRTASARIVHLEQPALQPGIPVRRAVRTQ